MRQRRVTGIEERLAPYSAFILKPVNCESADCASDPLRFDETHSAASNANNSARWSSKLAFTCRVLPANPKLASLKQLYLRRHSSVKMRVSAEARCIVYRCDPQEYHLRWYERASDLYEIPKGFDRVYVEFGCGRGKFINTLAEKDPDGLYIGIEGCKTIVLRAIQKTHASGLQNLFYIDSFINDAAAAFKEETLDGIFLNFSDPWPKVRHAERRLTAPAKAASYKRVLKPGGIVILKTDSEDLFEYSLKSFEDAGFNIDEYNSNDVVAIAIATPTEYEEKYRALGRPVYSFIAANSC
jgi:tRNA (guanine-N7-)-methyltransferase